MRLALLTSTHYRHRWFARELARQHELVLTVAEAKGNQKQMEGATEADTELLRDHFDLLRKTEKEFFGEGSFPADCKLIEVERGGINEPRIAQAIRDSAVEGIAVFGPGILKRDLLNCCPDHIINAHQGLSPYLRGAATNFWPFVEGRLDLLGATLHWIDEGIDTGGIICHVRPEIESNDTMHEIGCKTIAASAQCMRQLFSLLDRGVSLPGISQWQQGKLYQRKDFNAQAVQIARLNMAEGLVENYLENRKRHGIGAGIRTIELEKRCC